MKHILFISDNSITHPILHSQGIPHILKNSDKYRFSLLTFETAEDYRKDEFKRLSEFLYSKNVNLIACRLPRVLFPNGRFWVWLLGVIYAISFCVKDKPSIIHARSYSPTLIALICKLLFGVKVLFDMRGIFVDEMVEAGIIRRNSLLYWFERSLEKIYFRYSDIMVSVSEKHLNFANKQFLPSIKVSDKNYLIRNCVDIEKFNLSERENRRSGEVKLVYTGNYSSKYDISSIFNFFDAFRKEVNSAKLMVLTYIDEKPFNELLSCFPEEMREKVVVRKCESWKIPSVINQCDAGMLLLNHYPSNEVSAPIKFIEYLASGIPVILSENVGDCNSIIEKYEVGVTIRNNDFTAAVKEVRALLCQPDLGNRCRNVAVNEFNISDACKKYDELYLKLILGLK